jgi:hypothetical protein
LFIVNNRTMSFKKKKQDHDIKTETTRAGRERKRENSGKRPSQNANTSIGVYIGTE